MFFCYFVFFLSFLPLIVVLISERRGKTKNATERKKLFDRGLTEGYSRGELAGYKRGFTDGEKSGYEKGREEGFADGHRYGASQSYNENVLRTMGLTFVDDKHTSSKQAH